VRTSTIVCDSTLAVDALLRPDGPSGRLVRRFLERREFDLVLSGPLLEEIRRAATDPKVLARLELSVAEVERWVVSLGVLATLVGVEHDEDRTGPETDDDPVLVAAAAVGEAVVVTLDPELLAKPATGAFEAVRPEVLLEVLEAQAESSASRAV
jgi:predicted nucleic acid-binding protein